MKTCPVKFPFPHRSPERVADPVLDRVVVDQVQPQRPGAGPVDAVTVYVEPEPDTPVIAGVPPSPTLTREKSAELTPVTDSLNTTFQDTDEPLVGLAPERLIELTVGGVRSTTQLYEVGELVAEPDTARTWKVCEPPPTEYDFELGRAVPQSTNVGPSSEHWNFVTDCESVYVNDADVLLVGSDGFELIDGAAGRTGAAGG